MAGPATNAATISVILNSLGKKIAISYVSVIFISSILFGSLINMFLDPNTIPMNMAHHHHHNSLWNIFSNLSVSAMLIIIFYYLFSKINRKSNTMDNINSNNSYLIQGMTCNHCKQTATEAIESCAGVEKVDIELDSGQAIIKGNNLNQDEIFNSIKSVGFSISKLT